MPWVSESDRHVWFGACRRLLALLSVLAVGACRPEVPRCDQFAEMGNGLEQCTVGVATAETAGDGGVAPLAADVAASEVPAADAVAEGSDAVDAFAKKPCENDCNDKNPCTTDVCSGGACVNVKIDGKCDDGDPCTTGDACVGGICKGGGADCDDANECTADSCDVVGCKYSPLAGTCGGAASCIEGGSCKAGTCEGVPKSCNDGNDCTADSCAAGVCGHTAMTLSCTDNDPCTFGDTCVAGICSATPTKCDDGNWCTSDACANGGCEFSPVQIPCDDGDACTLADACSGGICKGTSTACASPGEKCFSGSCSPILAMKSLLGGEFKMGCADGDAACGAIEKPQHTVKILPFFICETEVTAWAYAQCVTAGVCTAPKKFNDVCVWGVPGKAQHPINCVDWFQASAFCAWGDAKGRLPTEAEWEYAARGGLVDKKYPWGNQPPTCTPDQINMAVFRPSVPAKGGCGQAATWQVATGSLANGHELFDMAGNVYEWVADWVVDGAYYAASPYTNPAGPPVGVARGLRGGCYDDVDVNDLRVSYRWGAPPTSISPGVGFRCARSP